MDLQNIIFKKSKETSIDLKSLKKFPTYFLHFAQECLTPSNSVLLTNNSISLIFIGQWTSEKLFVSSGNF